MLLNITQDRYTTYIMVIKTIASKESEFTVYSYEKSYILDVQLQHC